MVRGFISFTVMAGLLCTASPAKPAMQYSYAVVEPHQGPAIHKPKVIGDFANNGLPGVGIYTAGEGFRLYKYPGFTPFLITNFQNGPLDEEAQVADINGDGAPD